MRRQSILAVLLCISAVHGLVAEEWKVPPKVAAAVNPVAVSEAAITAGRKLYGQNCQSCHGDSGAGDGIGAAMLKPKPAPLNSPEMAAQTDGDLFYKITIGRGAMPPWQTMLSDEQRWQVVLFIRTLQPSGKAAPAK